MSYRLKKRLEGSFDPISRKTLALFFPFLQPGQEQNEAEKDIYSETLADIVIAKIKARLQEDLRNSRPYPIKKGERYWAGKEPFWGLEIGSWKPWILLAGDQFRLAAPPDDNLFWQDQVQAVKLACDTAGEDKKRLVYFWAGISRKGASQSGDWLKIANDYMWNQHIPLAQMLLVRATLAMGIEDATIAAFDSKYTYWVKRPSMLDNQLKTFIAVPNHPSYPSGHSTIASTSRVILAYFFPQAQSLWSDLAHEAGWSRIWCGLHFPIDDQVGKALGEKIGQAAIQAIPND